MLIVLKTGSTPEDRERARQLVEALGFEARPVVAGERSFLRVVGDPDPAAAAVFASLPGVIGVLPTTRPVRRADVGTGSQRTVVRIGGLEIGGARPTIVAGPCAVESEEQLLPLARRLRDAGADILRGGAWKPRTSPHEFQGLGEEGLLLLARARDETGLPVVTEAVDEASFERVEELADIVQIGARNMQNFSLLRRAGRGRRPVLLKRGFAATLEEWLHAAEYVLDGGNSQVILCERGIRTFSVHSRFTLDLAVVPALRRITHLPVFVDPSHASGLAGSVAPLARAALAAGADGVMVEVHPDPARALCDGPQCLLPAEFSSLAAELRAVAGALGGSPEPVS